MERRPREVVGGKTFTNGGRNCQGKSEPRGKIFLRHLGLFHFVRIRSDFTVKVHRKHIKLCFLDYRSQTNVT
jgi:hypothetical protein